MSITRRRDFVIGGLTLGGLGIGAAASVIAGPPVQQRRLSNRLELWHEYANRTETLLVRVATRRETSLLSEPLTTTGSLLFIAPSTIVIRDDSASGSTTLIDTTGTRVLPNRADIAERHATRTGDRPAADWLATRLLRTFAPVSAEALTEGCRAQVPKGRGYRLDLLPPTGSAIRRVVRSYSLTLDPAAGAVTRIAIAEAQGDRITLGLSDHRQNIAAQDLASITTPLADRGIELPLRE